MLVFDGSGHAPTTAAIQGDERLLPALVAPHAHETFGKHAVVESSLWRARSMAPCRWKARGHQRRSRSFACLVLRNDLLDLPRGAERNDAKNWWACQKQTGPGMNLQL